MQVVHVIATSVHDMMGVTTALREIVAAQVDAGLDVRLLVQGGWPGDIHPGARLVQCSARDLPGHLAELAGFQGVVHSHVPWRLPALAPLLVRRRARAFVHSPHGSFAPAAWAIHPRRKRVAWGLVFGHAIRRNDLIVANSAAEQADVEALRLGCPTIRIPHPITAPVPPPRRPGGARTIAFLGRLHPIKGVLELVQAWMMLGGSLGWTLRIAGPAEDPAYAERVRAAAAGRPDIEFVPAIMGPGRWSFLAGADVVAVPSHSENFCYVVAEAMAMGIPVLATNGVPWPEIEGKGLGWRGEASPEGLRAMLTAAIAASEGERAAMGARARRHIEAEYAPSSVAWHYARAYEGVLG